MKEQSEALGTEKISKLLVKLSIPSTIGMTVMALYNLVDTIFVGQGVGTMAIGGLAIVMPIQMLVFAAAMVLGTGGSSVISRALGENNEERTSRTFGNLITLTFIMGILLTAGGYLFARPLLFLFGAQGEILPFATDYFLVVFAGTPFLSYAMIFNAIIRAEGDARSAMMVMITASIINIVLDPIFIFGLKWGVKGAAAATVVSQTAAFLYMFLYYARGKSSIKFHFKHLALKKAIVKEVFAIGASSLARHGAASALMAILNHILYIYGGALSVSVYGIINRVFRVVFMPIFGIVQAYLPITGFNYGAKNFSRVRETFWKSTIVSSVIITLIFAFLMIFARQVMAVFSSDQALIEEGSYAIRIILLATPLIGFQVIGASYFQAIGKALPSFFLALSRQVLLLLPLVIILPRFWGLNGVWASFPIADFLSAFITTAMLIPELRRLRQSTDADINSTK